MEKIKAILAWIVANKKIVIPIAIILVVVVFGGISYGCGYIKGCNKAKQDIITDEVKK